VNASLRRLVPSHENVPRLQRIPIEARYESRLVFAANPALFALLTLGRFVGPIRRVPRLGWLVTDPLVARRLLGDSAHTSLVGEGGVGHLWAQLLGDWVNEAFDGPGHAELRGRGKDLFTDASARRHVVRVFQEPAARLTYALSRGDPIDISEIARIWVGRMVADLLGLTMAEGGDDAAFRSIFAHGERLAALARRTIGSTVIPPKALNPLTLTLRSRPRVMPKPEDPETVPQQCQEQRHGGQCPGHETRIVSGQFGGGIKGHPLQISSTRRWIAPLRSGGVRSEPHGRLLRGRGGGGAAGV
jgi:cytochrome P450